MLAHNVGEGDVATHTGTMRQGHKHPDRQRGIAHTDPQFPPQFQTDDRATSVFDGDPQRHKETGTGTHKHTQSEK